MKCIVALLCFTQNHPCKIKQQFDKMLHSETSCSYFTYSTGLFLCEQSHQLLHLIWCIWEEFFNRKLADDFCCRDVKLISSIHFIRNPKKTSRMIWYANKWDSDVLSHTPMPFRRASGRAQKGNAVFHCIRLDDLNEAATTRGRNKPWIRNLWAAVWKWVWGRL